MIVLLVTYQCSTTGKRFASFANLTPLTGAQLLIELVSANRSLTAFGHYRVVRILPLRSTADKAIIEPSNRR